MRYLSNKDLIELRSRGEASELCVMDMDGYHHVPLQIGQVLYWKKYSKNVMVTCVIEYGSEILGSESTKNIYKVGILEGESFQDNLLAVDYVSGEDFSFVEYSASFVIEALNRRTDPEDNIEEAQEEQKDVSVYKIYAYFNAADTWRDPDDINVRLMEYVQSEEEAIDIVLTRMQKYIGCGDITKDIIENHLKTEGMFRACSIESWGECIELTKVGALCHS